jgi:hypothetical protein
MSFPYTVLSPDDNVIAHYPTLSAAVSAIRQEQMYRPEMSFDITDRETGWKIATFYGRGIDS